MKRFFLFFSSFIIVCGFMSWLYLALSPNHAALQQAFIGGGKVPRQVALVNAVEFEKAHIRAIFGNAQAQYKLGRYFKTGEAGTKDEARALFWMHKSAAQNNPDAMMSLARFAFTGYGMNKNEEEGAKWVAKAAQLGSSPAQGLMGILYIGGIGVEQDFNKAQEWLGKSKEVEAQMLSVQMQAMQNALSGLPDEERARVDAGNKEAARGEIRGAFEKMINK